MLSCDKVRDMLPEVALGTISGKERGMALAHIDQCLDCRQEVEELAEVADDIFLLVGEVEPPAGFEGRVVSVIGQDRRQRRLWRTLPLVAAALIAAIFTAGGLQMLWHDDRELATRYRQTLEVANGRYFKAVPLKQENGLGAGSVFAYQGSPSWLFVTFEAPGGTAKLSVTLETEDGRAYSLSSMDVTEGHGSWGHELPVDLEEAASLRLWDPDAGSVYEADL